MRKIFIAFIFSSLLFSCGSNDSSELSETVEETPIENEEAEVEEVENNSSSEVSTEGKFQINRVFATSTAIPIEEYSVLNLFDSDNNTIWKTMTGSGPEEGIMIYLENPIPIHHIEPVDENGKSDEYFEIYANGGRFIGGNSDIKISSLFIKATSYYKSKSEKDGNIRKLVFPKNEAFILSELKFYKDESTVYDIVIPTLVKGEVTASSSLTPAVAYGAANVVDGARENAWAENAKGDGIGETLKFSFDNEITINQIQIWNGYQRSVEHKKANASVKQFTISSNNGQTEQVTIENANDGQKIKLSSVMTGNEFEIKIDESYPGSKYQDLVISEIQFYNNNVPYMVKTTSESERVQNNQKVKSGILENVLDHNLNFSTSENEKEGNTNRDFYKTSSILLRSNNTFVLYERETESFYNEGTEEENYEDEYYEDNVLKEVIADGSWELKSQSADKVEIRIFGKKFTPTSDSDVYKGEVENSSLKIFQDYITVTPGSLQGKSVVSKISTE